MNQDKHIDQLLDALKTVSVKALECAERKDIGRLTGFINQRASLLEAITVADFRDKSRSSCIVMLEELLLVDKEISKNIIQDMEDTRQNIEQAVRQHKLSRRYNGYLRENAMIINKTV